MKFSVTGINGTSLLAAVESEYIREQGPRPRYCCPKLIHSNPRTDMRFSHLPLPWWKLEISTSSDLGMKMSVQCLCRYSATNPCSLSLRTCLSKPVHIYSASLKYSNKFIFASSGCDIIRHFTQCFHALKLLQQIHVCPSRLYDR